MEPINIKPKEEPKGKLNRAGRRQENHATHHNVFTKKYHSSRAREAAWENFLGPQQYAAERKYLKQMLKDYKAKKLEAKNKRLGTTVSAKTI